MVYAKSIVAGLGALILSSVLFVVIYAAVIAVVVALPSGQTVGIDFRSVFVQPLFWVITLLSFAAGFYWEYRKVRG
jgi:hypothetical protein